MRLTSSAYLPFTDDDEGRQALSDEAIDQSGISDSQSLGECQLVVAVVKCISRA